MLDRQMTARHALLAFFLLLGCGDDSNATGGGGDSTSTSSTKASATNSSGSTTGSGSSTAGMATTSTGMMGLIPDPGNEMGGEWTDIEPNDTPDHAVPMGILAGPIWAGFSEPYTAINPETDVDYFVFKTNNDLASINMQLCWSFAGNLLDMNLYEVQNQMQGMLVASSADTAPGCETLIDFGEGPTMLTANTTYLLEVRGAPGLDLAGDPGLYNA
jgi:hypothetical protein